MSPRLHNYQSKPRSVKSKLLQNKLYDHGSLASEIRICSKTRDLSQPSIPHSTRPFYLTHVLYTRWLDGCLGFSAGVMLAASYWSLLDPAVSLAETNGYGVLSFLPAAVGFLLGAVAVYAADQFLPDDINSYLIEEGKAGRSGETAEAVETMKNDVTAGASGLRKRKGKKVAPEQEAALVNNEAATAARSWRR